MAAVGNEELDYGNAKIGFGIGTKKEEVSLPDVVIIKK